MHPEASRILTTLNSWVNTNEVLTLLVVATISGLAGWLAQVVRRRRKFGWCVLYDERAGYVRRVPDPRDARARLVRIAERGLAAVAVARQTEAAVEAEWTRHLGRAGAAQLRRALTRLREITDPYQ